MSASAQELIPVKLSSGDFNVDILQCVPEGETSKRMVLIIPPTGGVNFIDRSYANSFCEKGIGASILKNWSGDDEYNLDLEIHKRFYHRSQKAIDMAIEHYREYRLGILGTSVGGLHASIALQRRDEILAGFFIVSGGNIASIIAHTTQEILVDAKEKRFKIHGFKTAAEYEQAIAKILPYEPLSMKGPGEKKLGMILSSNDDVVPTENQKLLRKHLNPTYLTEMWLGHTATVVASWLFYKGDVASFFEQY